MEVDVIHRNTQEEDKRWRVGKKGISMPAGWLGIVIVLLAYCFCGFFEAFQRRVYDTNSVTSSHVQFNTIALFTI